MAAENTYLEKFREDFADDRAFQRVLEESRKTADRNDERKESRTAVWDGYPRIDQPEDLTITLFAHQRVAVYNMENLERIRKISRDANSFFMTDFGILGDIPGYGKSFSIVALILRDKMPWDIKKCHDRNDLYTYNNCLKVVQRSVKTRVRANLVLASPTLIEQWKHYFSFVKPGKLAIRELVKTKDLAEFDPNDYDVVLCSSARYNELIDQVGQHIVWRRFIFDEAGSTHIAGMKPVHAGFVWFVTATYEQLLGVGGNGNHYMKTFFYQIGYDILTHFVIRNETAFVKHSFIMPDVHHLTVRCLNPRVLNVLSSYIDADTRVMISAGDIRGALARLGGGTTNDTNLFELVAKRQHEKLSQAKFSLQFWKERVSSAVPATSAVVKEVDMWTKRVADIEKAISELEDKYKNVLNDDCTICYSEIQDPVLLSCCQNVFCGRCIMKWLETTKTCPMCRAPVNVKELIYIQKGASGPVEERKVDDSPKPKHKAVTDILLRDPSKKFLICSMFDESFSLIRRELEENRMGYVEISGTKTSRDSKLKRFREGNVNIIFLNSRFNGAGINLEMVTDIILYHEMPAPIEEQVIGRALRIGRKGDVTVHHLMC